MAKQSNPGLLRCLAIQQPFSWALCAGIKTVENRSWSTDYRGLVAIYASTTKTSVNDLVRQSKTKSLRASFFTFGAVIGIATIVDVVEMNRSLEDNPDAGGPICWIVEDARLLQKPVAATGRLNLYSLTEAESEAVRRQLPGLQPTPLTEEAREWLSAYRAGDADPFNMLVARGNSYYELERIEDAIRTYNEALRREPDSVEVLCCRGNCYAESERPDDAIKDFDAALLLEPDNTAIVLARVVPYLWGKKAAEKVIHDCSLVINSDPKNALAYMFRREAFRQCGEHKMAEADRRKAAGLDPELVEEWEDETWE